MSHDGEDDGQTERSVGQEAQLEHRLGLRSAGQSVEHVEEHETGEGHGGVPVGDLEVLHHLLEYIQGAADYDGGGQKNIEKNTSWALQDTPCTQLATIRPLFHLTV